MRLVIVSGLSGAGKSVALHMLEDLGYYCIDNMPAALLKPFISHTVRGSEKIYERTAIGLDARNTDVEIASVPTLVDELKRSGIECEVLFLIANDEELLRRFAETRRAHPLSRQGEGLRDLVYRRLDRRSQDQLSLLFESFGFKHGIPGDADFVFDARSLPNPYWESALRPLTGRDPAVVRFLEEQPMVRAYIDDVTTFMKARIPEYRASARRYLTIAVGCTGGQHRSVYIAEQLAARFASEQAEVRVRHAELPEAAPPPAAQRTVRSSRGRA